MAFLAKTVMWVVGQGWLRSWLWPLLRRFVSNSTLKSLMGIFDSIASDRTARHQADAAMAASMMHAEAKVRSEEVKLAALRYQIGPTLYAILIILYSTAFYYGCYLWSKILKLDWLEPWPLGKPWEDYFFWLVMTLVGAGSFGTLDWVRSRWDKK